MTQYVQAKIETMEQPITAWLFLSIAIFSMLAYAYFVNGAITYIVAAKEAQSLAMELSASVSTLEKEYIAVKSSIDMEQALADGFRESASETVYVAKKPLAGISFNR